MTRIEHVSADQATPRRSQTHLPAGSARDDEEEVSTWEQDAFEGSSSADASDDDDDDEVPVSSLRIGEAAPSVRR